MAWRYQRYDRSGRYGIPELKQRYHYNISRHGERHHMPGKFGNPNHWTFVIFQVILALNTRRTWYFTKHPGAQFSILGKYQLHGPFNRFRWHIQTVSECIFATFCSEIIRVATEHLVNVVNVAVSSFGCSTHCSGYQLHYTVLPAIACGLVGLIYWNMHLIIHLLDFHLHIFDHKTAESALYPISGAACWVPWEL